MKKEIKEKLFELRDEKYKEFHSGLCPGTDNIIGVRVPVLRNLAKDLAKEYGQKANNIFTFHEFLNRIQKDELEIRFSTNETNEDSVTIMTIHKSKGLQVDYVVIINNKNYGMDFPSKINDLSIIKLLLAGELDDYPYSEERRLFYVALTRSKK